MSKTHVALLIAFALLALGAFAIGLIIRYAKENRER